MEEAIANYFKEIYQRPDHMVGLPEDDEDMKVQEEETMMIDTSSEIFRLSDISEAIKSCNFNKGLGSDHDWSYFIQPYRALGCCLLQGHHPANPQVLWDVALVQRVHNLIGNLVAQGLVRLEDIPIKAVRSQSFIEVGAFDGLRDVCESEGF